MSWDASPSGESAGEMEVFPINQPVPFSKILTFYRQEPFAIKAAYSGNVPYPDKNIGKYHLSSLLNLKMHVYFEKNKI